MFPHEDSIVPIFLWRTESERLEQVGSAVLLRMGKRGFLLTAGHVADLHVEGKLCVPTRDGIAGVFDGVGGNRILAIEARSHDPVDVGYLTLTSETVTEFHPPLCVLERQYVDPNGGVEPGDICAVGGYSITKARAGADLNSSGAYSYVGFAADHTQYQSLGYDPDVNIVVTYRRKKSVFPEGDRINPPHPRGLSGGGIFRLSADLQPEWSATPRQLVGIIHTFKQRENCFVGTRLPMFLATIGRRFPSEVLGYAGT